MLNRVKCCLVDETTGAQKQFVVPVSSNFAKFAVREYAEVSSVAFFLFPYQ